jgi:hypothetical protein
MFVPTIRHPEPLDPKPICHPEQRVCPGQIKDAMDMQSGVRERESSPAGTAENSPGRKSWVEFRER